VRWHTGITTALVAIAALAVTNVAETAEARKVVIATEGSYAPWNLTEADGKLAGYEIDVATEMCSRWIASARSLAWCSRISICGAI
jgi:ABC-type amino acid transport substrate-binding protein